MEKLANMDFPQVPVPGGVDQKPLEAVLAVQVVTSDPLGLYPFLQVSVTAAPTDRLKVAGGDVFATVSSELPVQ